jgi:hypothetical protein
MANYTNPPLNKLSEPGCQLKGGMVLGALLFCMCENVASFLCVHHTVTVNLKIDSAKATFLFPSTIFFDRDTWAGYGSNK